LVKDRTLGQSEENLPVVIKVFEDTLGIMVRWLDVVPGDFPPFVV